ATRQVQYTGRQASTTSTRLTIHARRLSEGTKTQSVRLPGSARLWQGGAVIMKRMESSMRRSVLAVALVTGLITPAFAQRAEIEAVNAKWMEFFNKGDFAGVGSLYTEDATAFPPGSSMVKGRAAIEAMWKNMSEQISDPKVTTLDVKPLGPSAAREIGTVRYQTKGPAPHDVIGK